VFGETIDLPRARPAKAYLVRARYDGSEGLTVPIIADLLRPFVGDRVDTWIADDDMDEDQLLDVFHRLGAIYGGEADRGENRGPPSRGHRETSSPGGGTSSPTSDASTGST